MRRASALVFLIVGLSTTGFGQSLDEPCKTARNAAERKLSSGTIYFPRLIVESSLTLRKMLQLEYGIIDKIYDNGSDVEIGGEAECFYEVMRTEIDNKWGKDFLNKQRRVANSLDKKGIGYVEPKENGIADTLSFYLKREHVLDLVNTNYLVRIKISGNKSIVDVGVFFGLPYAEEISRDLSDYLIINESIHRIGKIYEPGQLRGKPVESTLEFWIGM
jgi:hypothetical protein